MYIIGVSYPPSIRVSRKAQQPEKMKCVFIVVRFKGETIKSLLEETNLRKIPENANFLLILCGYAVHPFMVRRYPQTFSICWR